MIQCACFVPLLKKAEKQTIVQFIDKKMEEKRMYSNISPKQTSHKPPSAFR